MYAPRGFSGSELGDVEVVFHDGALHLFHLTLTNHDVIEHAVSVDGIVWERRPPALHTGPPGAFDDDQLWTMGIVRHHGRFFMLYTALSRAEAGRVQRVGLAVSDDLETWEKLPGPVSEATTPYRVDREGAPWVAWRDPKPVVLDDGRVHAVLCARDPSAPSLRQGTVAHLVSDDLRRWETLPPLFAPRSHVELECPQLFPFAGRLYLTAAVLDDRTQRYWVADDLSGPFATPDDHALLPAGHYAARVCPVRDEHWVFAFHDAGGSRGLPDRIIPAPLRLVGTTGGTLTCRRTTAWDERKSHAEDLDPSAFTPSYGSTRGHRDGATFACEEGAELFFHRRPGDALFELSLELDAPLVGIALSRRADGGGTFVSLDRGASRVSVWTLDSAEQNGHPWFRRVIVAEGRYQPKPALDIELIRAGGELLISIEGEVVVSTTCTSSDADGVGLLVESGRVRLCSARVSALRV